MYVYVYSMKYEILTADYPVTWYRNDIEFYTSSTHTWPYQHRPSEIALSLHHAWQTRGQTDACYVRNSGSRSICDTRDE